MFRVLKALGAVAFLVALPLAIVLTNARIMIYDRDVWESGYQKHGVGRTTGMTQSQLREASDQILAYFRGGPMVSLQVQKEWGQERLFNQKEQTHLSDVRDLIRQVERVQVVSLAVLVVVAGGILLLRRDPRPIARLVIAGTILTVGVFALLGLLAVGDFDQFWLQFHLLSFSNDFWSLDPRTDYMIRMYPEGFWFDVVTELIGRSSATAIVLMVLSHFYLRLGRRPQSATR